ncbi:MAG: hypothetical protein WBA57_24115 [Elainellaceae cyanobacterium]
MSGLVAKHREPESASVLTGRLGENVAAKIGEIRQTVRQERQLKREAKSCDRSDWV